MPEEITKRELPPCPNKPNCVHSQDSTKFEDKMQPLVFKGNPSDSFHELRDMILRMPRSRLIEETSNYMKFEFRSRVFRFVDDVEFSLDLMKKHIHFRSSSRVGHSDLGANRRRMGEIIRKFQRTLGRR